MLNVFILKKTGYSTWGIFSPNGNMIHEFRAGRRTDAEEYARAYISSWSGSTFIVGEGNE